MLLNSFQFLFFFIGIAALYFVIPHNKRWVLLLAASCYFYMAFVPIYILILGFTILVDYIAGICIESTQGKKRKGFLICSIIANVGVLAVFKYYNFLLTNFSMLFKGFAIDTPLPHLDILLPIGLSFHTFQAMSYTIEVYRGRQKAERHFGIYSLYVLFFPQLVAGPIERPQNLIHQFREPHLFDSSRVIDGLKQMLWGFFKKLVIADRLAIYVNLVYNNPQNHTGQTCALATLFFAVQIYCDFSGYSDIAIGAARVLGIKLMTNFNRPYFARTISEFWKRWHISLSTWFKDYLYIPLGGNRCTIPRQYLNLLIVFVVSGLWHGANWTFIIWGALNGGYLIFGIITRTMRNRLTQLTGLERIPFLHHGIQIAVTFLLSSFAWIFFRANTVSDATTIIRKIIHFDGPLFVNNARSMMLYYFAGIFFVFVVEFKKEFFDRTFSFFTNGNRMVRFCSYAVLVILILLVGVFDGGQFIYFQF